MNLDSKTKYSTLPADIQHALASVDVGEKLQIIGKKHGLHMDQIGRLGEEIDAVILGNADSDEFVDKIEKNLYIETDQAIAITTDVNIEIFMALRQAVLQVDKTELTSSTSTVSTFPEPSRESILAEIENPTPSIHPISAVDQTVAGPALTREIVAETKTSVAHDFIGSKLTETVSLPSQKAVVELVPPAPKAKSYSADPYRESIN